MRSRALRARGFASISASSGVRAPPTGSKRISSGSAGFFGSG
jgi:hypothetical protein